MKRAILYLWAIPNTLLGLLPAPIVWMQGGHICAVDGVIEISGGAATWLLKRFPVSPSAMTLGHVVWGRDTLQLERTRAHERVHVRQYERWGPFFIPAYLGASLYLKIRGCDAYYDNPFEREAYRIAP